MIIDQNSVEIQHEH